MISFSFTNQSNPWLPASHLAGLRRAGHGRDRQREAIGDYQMINCDHQLVNPDYQMVNCDYPMVIRDYQMVNCDYQMVIRDYPMVNHEYQMVDKSSGGDDNPLQRPQWWKWSTPIRRRETRVSETKQKGWSDIIMNYYLQQYQEQAVCCL